MSDRPERLPMFHSPNIHACPLLQTLGFKNRIFSFRGGRGRHGQAHLVQGGALGGAGPSRGGDPGVTVAVGRIVTIAIESCLKTGNTRH